MASGCIMGECPACGDIVCEDEWRIFDKLIMHPRCVPDYVKKKHRMNEDQFLRLCGAQELRQVIQDTRESFKDSMDFYNAKLQDLEEQLVSIEKEGKT
jgi:hypothetical protein